MKYHLLALLLIVAAVVHAMPDYADDSDEADMDADPDCPEDEEWSDCGKTCEFNCEMALQTRAGLSPKCKSLCDPGCICIYPLARAEDGTCVKSKAC